MSPGCNRGACLQDEKPIGRYPCHHTSGGRLPEHWNSGTIPTVGHLHAATYKKSGRSARMDSRAWDDVMIMLQTLIRQ